MIWQWYATHKRTLPWRDLTIKNPDERAYRILVSEVMLQQTQVSRVIVIYKRFLREFPKMKDLARATDGQIILAWRGLGYNSRALRLRDASRKIHQSNNASMHQLFPRDMEELMALPGVGHYTAAAVRNFAFNIPTPCLDTNIRQVLQREFRSARRKSDVYLLRLAGEILKVALLTAHSSQLPACRTAAEWHAALMDYGTATRNQKNQKNQRKEPGRLVGSQYVPNRIFRGKIVEELRDASGGLSLAQIGRNVCIDWEKSKHEEWLQGLLAGLERDRLVARKRGKYLLPI